MIEEPSIPTIAEHFGDMSDPRVDRTKLHELLNILVIAICAKGDLSGNHFRVNLPPYPLAHPASIHVSPSLSFL